MPEPEVPVADHVAEQQSSGVVLGGRINDGSLVRNMGDGGLLAAIGTGQADALAEIYERHGASVYRFACRLCGPGRAETVTHLVFLHLWQTPQDFHSQWGSPRQSLLGAAHRHGVAQRRDNHALRAAEATMSIAELDAEILGPDHADEIRAHLAALTADQRTAVSLAYYGGYTYREIARLVGRAALTIAKDMSDGLRRPAGG